MPPDPLLVTPDARRAANRRLDAHTRLRGTCAGPVVDRPMNAVLDLSAETGVCRGATHAATRPCIASRDTPTPRVSSG